MMEVLGVDEELDFFLAAVDDLGDFLPVGAEFDEIIGTDLESLDFNSGVLGPEFFELWGCLIRFLDLMVSVFKLMGRGRPWSFKNNPQALHNTWPVSSRLHKGVVCVLQFLHTGLVILVLVVVVPLLIWVVVLALGCTGWDEEDDNGVDKLEEKLGILAGC